MSVTLISDERSERVEYISFLKPKTTAKVITITAMLTATAEVAMRTIVLCVDVVDLAVRLAINNGKFIVCGLGYNLF